MMQSTRERFSGSKRAFATGLVAAALAVTSVLTVAPAHAADPFTVNSAADPGDGVCNASECTLREGW